jgi:periplasmic protein TonB
MAPSIHIDVPPEPQLKDPGKFSKLEIPKTNKKPIEKTVSKINLPSRPAVGTFQSSMLEYHHMQRSSRFIDILISLVVNASLLIVPIFAGLYFSDSIDLKGFAATFLVAPPPPPPPPPAAAPAVLKAAPVHKVFENSGKLVAPTVVPKQVAMLKESPIPDVEGSGGVPGGVPGGVAGGSMGGVIGGVIGGVGTVPMPVAPKEKGPRAPIRVGGRVKEPRLISRVDPKYPALAVQTHMEGTVIVDAVIDEHGDVIEARVVSGPPLLIQPALEAVRRWKYEPTYLNDEPISVQLNVTVSFRLSGD